MERFNELLLRSAGVALAVFDRKSRQLLFNNKRLAEWFPASEEHGAALTDIFPGIDEEKMDLRLSEGRAFNQELTIKVGRRETVINLRIETQEKDGADVLGNLREAVVVEDPADGGR